MSKSRYSAVAVALHWLVAIGILYNLVAMLLVDDNDRSRAFLDLHKSIGITVLGLALLRILWRIGHTPPPLLPTQQPWERKLATAVHHTLYLLIVLVPLSGWLLDSAYKDAAKYPLDLYNTVHWFRLPPFTTMDPADKQHWHHILGFLHTTVFKLLLWLALALHLAGALKHQFIDRQPEFRRMWFGRD